LLTQLAEKLLEKEVIFKEDLENIFGKRKFERDIEAEAEEKLEAETNAAKALASENKSTETIAEIATETTSDVKPEDDKKDPEPPKTTLF
jgi:hypothetical protein